MAKKVPFLSAVANDLARDARDASAKTSGDRAHGLVGTKRPLDLQAVVVGEVAIATGILRHAGTPLCRQGPPETRRRMPERIG